MNKIFVNDYDCVAVDPQDIPGWAKWLAVDSRGNIQAFEQEPSLCKQYRASWTALGSHKRIGKTFINRWSEAKWKIAKTQRTAD